MVDTGCDELPEGQSESARRERERFLASYKRYLDDIDRVALTILVWGKNPKVDCGVSRKRKEIRDELIKRGHNALFSEDVPGDFGRGLSEKTKEFAQGRAAHLIISLIEDAPGASAEVHDFCNHPDLAPKFFVMIPSKYKGGYSANGAIRMLEGSYKGVYWYKDRDLSVCNVLKESLRRAQAMREIHYSYRLAADRDAVGM